MKMQLTHLDADVSNSSIHLYDSDECSDDDIDLDLHLAFDKTHSERRKRQNLSHLSAEEKMERRQMKNRIAAQRARDRRKAKMDLLISRVSKLTKETIQLKKQTAILMKTNSKLMDENQSLRGQLEVASSLRSTEKDASECSMEVELNSPVVSSCPVESAELIHVSPKKTQGSEPVQPANSSQLESKKPRSNLLLMQFVCLLMNLMNQKDCSNHCSNSVQSPHLRQAAVARISLEMDQPAKLKKLAQKLIQIRRLRQRLNSC